MPRFNRSYRGLFANRMIQFGNKISFAENKTRRTWKPNVQVKSMFSETLGRMLKFRMTTRAMRNIRKAGGIEEYLLKTKESEIKYPRALKIKQEIIEARAAAAAGGTAAQSEKAAASASRMRSGQQNAASSSQTRVVPSPFGGSVPAKAGYVGLQEALWL